MILYSNGYDNARLISKVLTLYYQQGLHQKEIAEALGMSVAKVNRLLKLARQQGWVEITIRTPFQSLFDLERQLQTIAGVPEAVIIPRLTDDPDGTLQAVGRAAANYLVQHLRDGDIICISGGKAVYAVSQALEPRRRFDVCVVPATGGVQGRHYTDVNHLATQIAERLGGKAYQLHAPIFVDTPEEREAVMSVRQIREVLDIARRAQIALVGVGSLASQSASYFDLAQLSEDEKKRFIDQGCGGGEILASVYGNDGQPCATSYNQRVIGLTLEELRAVPLAIGVAGTAEKIVPIYGALRGKYLKTLITDETAALGVLQLYQRGGS